MSHGKKIGLFGGSFDPIHFGHLNLAFELMEKKALDEVWFIPAQLNPHKTSTLPVSIEHRLKMVQLAIEGISPFLLKDLERHRPPPSYTIDTLRSFIAEQAVNPFPYQFYLLMGEDAIPGFFHWHLPEEIIRLVHLLIGSRSGLWQEDLNTYSLSIREAIEKGFTPTRLMDISSTDIRSRLMQHLDCRHLVSSSVLHYIDKNKLYQTVDRV